MAAFACVALIVGLVAGGVLFDGGNSSRTIAFKTDPSMAQASAELELGDDNAILVANGLPPAPAGKTYMVWLQRPGHAPEPTSALFTPRRDGSATASVTGDLKDVESVLINTEPVGGSTTPTSDPLHDRHAELTPSLRVRGRAGRSRTRSARRCRPRSGPRRGAS